MIFQELAERYPSLAPGMDEIRRAAFALIGCYRGGGKLLVCGNGGSCADAEHIVGELMKGFLKKRPLAGEARARLEALGEDGEALARALQGALPAVALNAPALSTAVINDLGGELSFAQQVLGLGKPGDALLGISTSGNAKNIHFAMLAARAVGMTTIGLTGAGGGRMAEDCDIAIRVPERETFKVQELHLPVYHALCAAVEAEFFSA